MSRPLAWEKSYPAGVRWDAPIETAFEELERSPSVVVTKAGQALGVLTRSDLLEFLARRRRA